jgi:hypothetical protein
MKKMFERKLDQGIHHELRESEIEYPLFGKGSATLIKVCSVPLIRFIDFKREWCCPVEVAVDVVSVAA